MLYCRCKLISMPLMFRHVWHVTHVIKNWGAPPLGENWVRCSRIQPNFFWRYQSHKSVKNIMKSIGLKKGGKKSWMLSFPCIFWKKGKIIAHWSKVPFLSIKITIFYNSQFEFSRQNLSEFLVKEWKLLYTDPKIRFLFRSVFFLIFPGLYKKADNYCQNQIFCTWNIVWLSVYFCHMCRLIIPFLIVKQIG